MRWLKDGKIPPKDLIFYHEGGKIHDYFFYLKWADVLSLIYGLLDENLSLKFYPHPERGPLNQGRALMTLIHFTAETLAQQRKENP